MSQGRSNVYKLRDTVNIKDPVYGAKGDGVAVDAAAIQAAIDAIDTSGGKGGIVIGPAGVYNLSNTTINLKDRVRVKFAGKRATIINYSGSGAAIKGNGVDLSGIEGCRIAIGSSATAIGLHLASTSASMRHGTFSDLEIVGESVAGQIGIHLDVTSPQIISENHFNDIDIINMAKPIFRTTGPEGNFGHNINIQDFGTGASPAAIDGPGNAEQFTNLRIAGVGAGVTTPIGIKESGSRNYYQASVDIGSGGSTLSSTGVRNIFVLNRAAGDTPIGTFSVTDQVFDAEHNTIPRMRANGTALVSGDFVLSAGWGTTASVNSVSGTDQAFNIRIDSAGVGQATNPTVTFTFKDGAWLTAPKAVAVTRTGGNQLSVSMGAQTKTTTTITFLFHGTPVAAEFYTFDVVVIG